MDLSVSNVSVMILLSHDIKVMEVCCGVIFSMFDYA